MIIGITGSFGSGKSTVAKMFKNYGFRIINIDKLYHNIYSKDKSLQKKIIKEFGTINRVELKKIVFKDSKKLRKLNQLTHPLILKETKKIIKNSINKNIVIDAPLLLESDAKKLVDKIIVVKSTKKNSIQRIRKKNKKYTLKEINEIMNSQMSLKEKIKYADFVVDNDKTVSNTKKQVNKIIKKLK